MSRRAGCGSPARPDLWGAGEGDLPGLPDHSPVEASAAPQGNVLRVVDEEGCEVTLTFVGTLLVAHDNGERGGMNVRFDGVYRMR